MPVQIGIADPNLDIVISGNWNGQQIYFTLPLDVANQFISILQEQVTAANAANAALQANPIPGPVTIPG